MKRHVLAFLLSLGLAFGLGGCVLQSGPVVFVLDLPLSGEDQALGNQFLMGAESAARWINQNGGIHGRSLELEVHDCAGLVTQSEAVAAAAAENDSALCLIGGVSTDCSMAAAAVCQSTSLPFFSLSENTEALSQFGERVFSFSPSKADQADFLCRQLADSQCIAVLYSNDFDGTEAFDYFTAAAAEEGLDVLAEPVNVSDYNFGLIIEKLRQTNADSMVIFTNAAAAADLLLHLHQTQWEIPVYIASCDTAKSITGVIGPVCKQLYTIDYGQDSSCTCDQSVPEGDLLLSTGCAAGFDAIWYLAECARNISGWLTRSSLCSAVTSLDGFCGLGGSLAFDGSGTAVREFRLLIYEDGQWIAAARQS